MQASSMQPLRPPEVKILQAPKRMWNAWEDKVEKESDQAMQVKNLQILRVKLAL